MRRVKTASGATAVQVVHKRGRQVLGIDHIGSAHDDVSLALLLQTAQERIHAGQEQLPLADDHGAGRRASGPVVAATPSLVLWQALESVYAALGFANAVPDDTFKHLVLGRIVDRAPGCGGL